MIMVGSTTVENTRNVKYAFIVCKKYQQYLRMMEEPRKTCTDGYRRSLHATYVHTHTCWATQGSLHPAYGISMRRSSYAMP